MGERVVAAAAGALFGAGLAISQMVDPDKVLAFLDVAGAWDPSLLLVLGAAVVTHFIGFRLVTRRPGPLYGASFSVPSGWPVDGRLIGGSALFGIGWGMAGYCPGPALSALVLGHAEPLWFVLAMLVGMFGYELLPQPVPRAAPPPT